MHQLLLAACESEQLCQQPLSGLLRLSCSSLGIGSNSLSSGSCRFCLGSIAVLLQLLSVLACFVVPL